MKTFLLWLCLPLVCFGQAFSFRDMPYMQPRGPAGATLLNGLQAAWNFDEMFFGPTNRFSDFGGQVLTNVGALTGSERSLSSGGVIITNSGAGYLVISNASMFGLNNSFTAAFWVSGGLSGSDPCAIGQLIDNSTFDWKWDGQTFLTHDAGGTLHQVIGTLLTSPFGLVICGYDAANNQVFISNNGGARVNASAGGSVKQTANMPLKIAVNPAAFDNFYFWNRVLTTAEVTQLSNGGFPIQYPFTNSDAGAITFNSYNWAIQANGGSTTTANSNAVRTLVDGMVGASLWTKAPVIFALGGSALTDALIPINGFWTIDGGNTYMYFSPAVVNHGFVNGDVSINGITGNGSTKYLDLSVNPSTLIPSVNSSAMMLYAYTANSAVPSEFDFGCFNGTSHYTLTTDTTGSSLAFGIIGDNGANPAPPGNGYMCVSRTANNRIDFYFANSGTAHASIANSTTANTHGLPNLTTTLFAWNNNSVVANYVNSTIPVVTFFNSSLSSADSLAYYNLVQAFLTTKGGGFR